MKASVFVLSAISLETVSPVVVYDPGYDHASVVTSHVFFPEIPVQVIEPHSDQGPATTQPAGGEFQASLTVNVGYVPDNLTEITDEYLFRLPIKMFEAKRDSCHPPTLDWSSDGCTKAPDDIATWNFLPACHRHDFGIRNYREQGRLNKSTKRRIDDQFREDLIHECDTHKITRRLCKTVAKGYYEVVKRIDPDLDRV